MHIHDTTVIDRERDFRQIWDLLTDIHGPRADTQIPLISTWSFCRFEDWVVFSAPNDRSALNRKIHLWKTAIDNLVGLAIIEGSERDFHVISHPDHPEIEPAIVVWVERHWPADGGAWVTYAEMDDAPRQASLADLGYRAEAPSETMHTYDLGHRTFAPELPPGFTFSTTAEDGDLLGRARLTSLAFHPERDLAGLSPPIVYKKRSYDAALDLVVRAPEGHMVALAAGFINATNGIAEVEPVGTHPAYRQRGLAKAVVTEVFRRLQDRGVRWVHIASAPEPAVSNRLYAGLGPVGQQRFVRWVKHRSNR